MSETYLKADGVTKLFKKNKVLDNISLSLEKGKIYGFQGRNGSGKTMLLRILSGLMKPTEGQIWINGTNITKQGDFPDDIGVLIEYPGFVSNYTGFKNLKLLSMIRSKINDTDIRKAITSVGLDPDDKKKYKKYSLGMKQRLGIAQAIMENQQLIMLDEPTNALDREAVHLVEKLFFDLKAEGKTILIASHDYETLKTVSDKIFDIDGGRIVNESERNVNS
ncbi:ATP-binding cassette domain-containing protein [Bacillus mojavensis]|uniref:ATP-binding cassette domain-containing protein n=1 Tax=Bacillus mojavensis TaxID=72360 RepID=UPI002DB97FFD|nr:ATP-binding cassette domain-containing protein [Bacillus mojavensis]MEC1732304.1 ATP-binding cassette domain-containing protein [Bacillus mojavensis]MED1006346.1 ATP-binding cassette domain-containing protein [Bacillus mojavensis]